jgi:hypothetical protein
VSATKVGLLLHDLEYSLQVVRKTREGGQSPYALHRPRPSAPPHETPS